MSWVSWIIGGVAAAGGMAAKELITNAGKKHIEEPYEAKRKAKNELVEEINIEEFIPEVEKPAPKKSRKKKEET